MSEELFSHVVIERRISRWSLSASGCTHLVAIAFLALWRFIGPAPDLNYRLTNYELQIIHYQLPEPLLFAASGRKGGGGGSKSGPRGGEAGQSGAPGSGQPGKATITLPAAAVAAAGPKSSPVQGPASEPARQAAAPKPAFEMPQKQAVQHRDLVIQPEFSPEIRIVGKVQLPNLFLWSREIQPPVRQLKTFVPGEPKRRPRSPMALPDAPPKVELPNQEVKVTDLKIGMAPELPKRPALPVFAATTAPVRIQRANLEAPSELPVSALPNGQPVNLLALMERPAPPAASYSVEGGNRFPGFEPGAGGHNASGKAGTGDGNGTANAGGAGGAGAGTGGGGSGAGVAGGGGGAGGSGSGAAGAGGGGGAGTGTGSGTAGSGSGAGGQGTGAGAGTGTGGGGKGSGSGSGSGTGAGAGTGAGGGVGPGRGTGGSGGGAGSGTGSSGAGAGNRAGGLGSVLEINGLRLGTGSVSIQTESPNTSAFDVVVVHQSTREIMPDSPGILSGQPVYTVYMAVPGSRHEWILQYAVPNSREPIQQRTENSIQLGAATPVRPPYPLRKSALQLNGLEGAQGRVVLYGAISTKGMVENLRVIRGVRSEIDAAVIACLRQFLFRPAVRDGVPILVEALFGIPLN